MLTYGHSSLGFGDDVPRRSRVEPKVLGVNETRPDVATPIAVSPRFAG